MTNKAKKTKIRQIKVGEIGRQDLLKMTQLSSWLDESDILFVTSRDDLDAVMARPSSLVNLLTPATSAKLLASIIARRLEEDETMTPSERDVAVLQVLVESPGIRLTNLSEQLNLQPSNLHRRLQLLVDEGLVIRDETDGNITYTASAIGAAAVEAMGKG